MPSDPTEQTDVFRFHGETFDPALDEDRLGDQARRFRDLMLDGVWRSLDEISDLTGDPGASVSARFRQMGELGYPTEKRRRAGLEVRGVWEYRMGPRTTERPLTGVIVRKPSRAVMAWGLRDLEKAIGRSVLSPEATQVMTWLRSLVNRHPPIRKE